MKRQHISIALLLAFGFSFPQLFGMCGTTFLWHNLNNCATPLTRINADVTDQNIDIQGTNAVFGPIHVNATTCDVLITVTSGDAVIEGCDATSRLYLNAAFGRTITFQLNNSLLFNGSATLADLPIFVQGGGEVIFQIEGGESVSFGTNLLGTGGARLFVRMGALGNQPTLLFTRVQPFGLDINSDININIGQTSSIGFVAVNANDVGTIEFDPSNIGTGQTFLNIANGGSFSLNGFQVNPVVNPTLADINFAVTRGLPRLLIVNPNIGLAASSFLRIVNANSSCPVLQFDPFCTGAFANGAIQTGFILGPGGTLIINDMTYLDYIGTATNVCCTFTTLDECSNVIVDRRLRNGSAFIVDGDPDNLTTSTIQFIGDSAIYFRSGVDKCGVVSADFTISPSLQTPCAGEIVFDVEGRLDIVGDPVGENGINVLSLQVDPTGCPVFVEGTGVNFPKRTFARDANGHYLQYNAGAVLVNNRVNIFNSSIMHTDSIHHVFMHNNLNRSDLNSDPTYIGGDSYLFPCHSDMTRPTVAFYNSTFRINTDVAMTGLDWLIGNLPIGNVSAFIYYSNGRCIDDGYGRNMILGVDECFELCQTTTDTASHLNIFQETSQAAGQPGATQILDLLTAPNSNCITEGIISATAIANQPSVHSIYLNNESNISIGTNGDVGVASDGSTFALTTNPTLFIGGAFFTFDTKGGIMAYPEASGTTGQGGIFVDANGTITILDSLIANFSTMVVKSRNGIVNLPERSVFFNSRVGITEWKITLTSTNNLVLVDRGQELSDYTIDWAAVIKDCSQTATTGFIPYDLPATPAACNIPPVTSNNLTNLPTIRGIVEQLQIKRSRIGNQAHLLVDGGFIRELVLLSGFDPAEAPVGFIVIQNGGHVGIGSAHKNVDSLEASVKLGVNGLMLVAEQNGGSVEINSDVIIDNVCHILTGTSFGVAGPERLTIFSTTPNELRVKSTGVLDLTDFTNSNQQLAFGGQLLVVFEPGARILVNGGTLIFTDKSRFVLESVFNTFLQTSTSVSGLDDVRVKLSGIGDIIFDEGSLMLVQHDTFFGVESFPTCTPVTRINMLLLDNAQLQIGNDSELGGAFQVGDASGQVGTSVNFGLILNGFGTQFQINSDGFFGLGAGVADKASDIPNQWLIGCLENVTSVTINIPEGIFNHNRIASGNSAEASLFTIGPAASYTFNFDPVSSSILGGGNLFTLACSTTGLTVVPTVTGFAGVISTTPVFQEANIMSSKALLSDKGDPITQPVNVSRQVLFDYLKTLPADNRALMPSPKTNLTLQEILNTPILGFITNGTVINRVEYFRILGGIAADPVNPTNLLKESAAHIDINTLGEIDTVVAIQQT